MIHVPTHFFKVVLARPRNPGKYACTSRRHQRQYKNTLSFLLRTKKLILNVYVIWNEDIMTSGSLPIFVFLTLFLFLLFPLSLSLSLSVSHLFSPSLTLSLSLSFSLPISVCQLIPVAPSSELFWFQIMMTWTRRFYIMQWRHSLIILYKFFNFFSSCSHFFYALHYHIYYCI